MQTEDSAKTKYFKKSSVFTHNPQSFFPYFSLSLCLYSLFNTAMKSDRKRLKAEKADLVNQMQQLYATLESREEQLRDFIRNYEQHRKVWPDHRLAWHIWLTNVHAWNFCCCAHWLGIAQKHLIGKDDQYHLHL